MPRVFSLSHYFDLDEKCEAVLFLLELTVAAGLPDLDWEDVATVLADHPSLVRRLESELDLDAYVKSLQEGTNNWRRVLLDDLEREDDCSETTHGLMILFEIATTSVMVEPFRLEEAGAFRRLDALLDMMGADGWVGDVRQHYFDAAEILVGERSEDWRPAALSGAQRVSTMLTFFHPFLGAAAATALDWVNVDAAASTGTTSSPVLARVLVTCALVEGEVQERLVASACQTLIGEMNKLSRRIHAQQSAPTGGDPQRVAEMLGLQRAQANGLRFLQTLTDGGSPLDENVDLPALGGQRLPDARSIVQAVLGPETRVVTNDISGTNRGIWSEANWIVVDCERDSDGAVTLLVKKAGE